MIMEVEKSRNLPSVHWRPESWWYDSSLSPKARGARELMVQTPAEEQETDILV